MKTYYAKPNEVEREWLLIDAEDQVLGRVASKAAHILKGILSSQRLSRRTQVRDLPGSYGKAPRARY